MEIAHRSTFLIVEDEALIAMDLEHTLRRLGYHDITAIPSCKMASDWLRTLTPAANAEQQSDVRIKLMRQMCCIFLKERA
jgi:AmiR/NasT family two-component response regulator